MAVSVVTALGLIRRSAPKPPAAPTMTAPASAPVHFSILRLDTFLLSELSVDITEAKKFVYYLNILNTNIIFITINNSYNMMIEF